MDHLARPKKTAIFGTFGQNFPIQSIEEGSTLHFLSKSAKIKILTWTTPPPTPLTQPSTAALVLFCLPAEHYDFYEAAQ